MQKQVSGQELDKGRRGSFPDGIEEIEELSDDLRCDSDSVSDSSSSSSKDD